MWVITGPNQARQKGLGSEVGLRRWDPGSEDGQEDEDDDEDEDQDEDGALLDSGAS
jgi:hypothetical protein